jgi:hypothetical protein
MALMAAEEEAPVVVAAAKAARCKWTRLRGTAASLE